MGGGEGKRVIASAIDRGGHEPWSLLNWRLGRPQAWSGHFGEEEKSLTRAEIRALSRTARSLVSVPTVLSRLRCFVDYLSFCV